MRTKTLLIAAAALAAAVTSSQAQSTVYSQNIVGYINTSLSSGYNLVANQLNVNNTNGASEVYPNLPDGTFFYGWNPASSSYTVSIFDTGGGSSAPDNSWYMSDYSTPTNEPIVSPGLSGGSFLQLPTGVTNTTAGSVVLSNTVALVTGYNLVGSTLPVGGSVITSTVNFLPPDGTFCYTWTGTAYVVNIYDTGGGSSAPANSWYMSDYSTPTNALTVTVGQGAFFQLPAPYSWTQVLTNN